MNEYLLTIAIPTYNRSRFLKRCLSYLLKQKRELDKIEIIVSDNASTDDTAVVVEEFKQMGLDIFYLRNEVNKGPDYNIAQCYNSAKGSFVLVLGDDDVLIENSLFNIIEILNSNSDVGIVFLNSDGIVDETNELSFDKTDALDYKVYRSQKSFINYVTYNVTFISGNIVNRKAIERIDLKRWLDSYLVQVPLILTAITMFPKNIVVNSKLLAVQIDNTGGYNLYKIFGTNFTNIINEIFTDDFEAYRSIIINDLFVRFFPVWIKHFKKENKFDNNVQTEEIKKLLSYNKYYKLTVAPLLVLPANLNVVYFYGIKLFGMARRKTLLALNSK